MRQSLGRKVSQDSLVSYGNNRYSVPWIYVGQCVDLKIMAGQLLISSFGAVIAYDDLLSGKHQQSVLQAHYAGLSVPKFRGQVSTRPQHDPYWQEEGVVAVRDLSIYEDAAFSGCASSTMH